jgi:hypothetical protein
LADEPGPGAPEITDEQIEAVVEATRRAARTARPRSRRAPLAPHGSTPPPPTPGVSTVPLRPGPMGCGAEAAPASSGIQPKVDLSPTRSGARGRRAGAAALPCGAPFPGVPPLLGNQLASGAMVAATMASSPRQASRGPVGNSADFDRSRHGDPAEALGDRPDRPDRPDGALAAYRRTSCESHMCEAESLPDRIGARPGRSHATIWMCELAGWRALLDGALSG